MKKGDSVIPWTAEIAAFLQHLRVERNLSENSIMAYKRDLDRTVVFMLGRSKRSARDVTRKDLNDHIGDLNRSGLSPRSVARAVSTLRTFYKFICEEIRIAEDPAEDLSGPRIGRPLPRSPGSEQVRRLVEAVDVSTPNGIRDRAMLETTYSSGLRVSEVIGMRTADLSIDEGVVRVKGKGRKERLVPIGRQAIAWIGRYLREARPLFAEGTIETGYLFLNERGRRLTRQTVWLAVKAAARTAGLRVSPHSLRHAFATHLVEADVDLRSVQEMLGHASITTTQVYTSVSGDRLKKVHAKFHPRG